MTDRNGDGGDKTGLDVLCARMRGESPDPPIMDTMGMKIVHVEQGFIRFEAIPQKRHLNSMGLVQGGFAASVLDAAAGCAVQTLLDAQTRFVTVDLNIQFFKAIRASQRALFGEGRILNMARLVAASRASLVDEQGRCYAHATGTFMLFR